MWGKKLASVSDFTEDVDDSDNAGYRANEAKKELCRHGTGEEKTAERGNDQEDHRRDGNGY